MTCETFTSLITFRLKQLGASHQTLITSFEMHVCVYELAATSGDISGSVTDGSRLMSNVVINPARLRFESAKLALISNWTVSAVKKPGIATSPCDDMAPYQLNSLSWRKYEASIHTESLINVKSLHTGCQRAVGGAAEAARRPTAHCELCYQCQSHTGTLGPITVALHRGYVDMLVCVGVYIPVGD